MSGRKEDYFAGEGDEDIWGCGVPIALPVSPLECDCLPRSCRDTLGFARMPIPLS